MTTKRQKIILILQAIVVVLLFAISFKGKTLLCDYSYEDLTFDGRCHTQAVPFYHTGIYLVEVDIAESCEDAIALEVCPLEDKGFLLQNTVSVQPGQGSVSYYVWSYKGKMINIIADANRESIRDIISIRAYSTCVLYRTISVLLLAIFGAVDYFFLLWIRKEWRNLTVAVSIFAISSLAFLPYVSGYMYIGADTLFHLLRIQGLYKTLQDHFHIPVLIQAYQNYGHGSISSMLYSDLFLYIPVLLMFCGFTIQAAYKAYMMIVIVAGVIIAYYSMWKVTNNKLASLVGTSVITLSPYHLFNFYNRGAVGEYTAMAFIPLVILGFWILISKNAYNTEHKKAKMYIVLGMSGIIQSHLLTTEMVAAILLVVCVWNFRKILKKEILTQLIQAVFISFCVNCRFLIMLGYALIGDTYNLSVVFGDDIQSWGASVVDLFTPSFQARPAIFIGVVAVGWLMHSTINRFAKGNTINNNITGFALLTLLTFILGTNIFPWDYLAHLDYVGKLVQSIQYPGRFYSLCVCASGFFISLLISDGIRGNVKNILAIVIIIFMIFESILYYSELKQGCSEIKLYTAENFGTTNIWNRNWLPMGLEVEELYFHSFVLDGEIAVDGFEITGTKVNAHVSNLTLDDAAVELPLTCYKGYAAWGIRDGLDIIERLEITKGEHEDMRIQIPAGFSGDIYVDYYTRVRKNVLCIINYCSIIAIVLRCYMGYKKGIKYSYE